MNDGLMDGNKNTTKLFVYGSLMPGESNYGHIHNFVRNARRGTVEGILVDLGRFPALVHGRGIVRGVMLDLDEEALATTDRIEGYVPDRTRCLYVREEVLVRPEDGQQIMAWTYVFADHERAAKCPQLIVGEVGGTSIFAWPGRQPSV